MKNPLSTMKGKVLLCAALIFVASVLVLWLVFKDAGLALRLLAIGLTLVLLWLAINWIFAAWTRQKQSEFDAGIAAREGIEDRKREWSAWTAELKKQGIDRYKLPMYLLVGEPQSGKSILLQNSDLHFPFGQSRLSGIGGTKGCDWWFTEEAVILDLAGRLFTHEGGKSDEAEWAAFLSLVSRYRPQCPANGVLLVLPCDALLQDSAQASAAKAVRMQAALLALVSKLEARLPVYVVLTKADKIFGFAETFHRLESQQRQAMLGWSRPASAVERPFEPEEARAAFDDLVERTRLVRAEMMASEILPEGQGTVDRMYAFPNELAAVYPNLAIYLERLFGESSLVDWHYFRGFYLTSGLQSGAPIAKVCTEILGQKGQADARALESIFVKSRAYFIKDLVRKRIFPESGLVRPTRTRRVRARRNAILGYGLASVILLLSVYFALDYEREVYAQSNGEVYEPAQVAAREVAGSKDLHAVVLSLERVGQAATAKRQAIEENLYGTLKDDFTSLYWTLFDTKVAPILEQVATDGWEGTDASAAAFQQRIEAIHALTDGGDAKTPGADQRALGVHYHPAGDDHRAVSVEDPAVDKIARAVDETAAKYDRASTSPKSTSAQVEFKTKDFVEDLDRLRGQRAGYTAPSSGRGRFQADLCKALESALRLELMQTLQTEYEKQIGQSLPRSRVVDELFAKDLRALVAFQKLNHGPVTLSDVDDLFQKGGVLEELLLPYRLHGGILPVADEPTHRTEFENRIQFLDELRRFLIQDGTSSLSDDGAKIALEIKPVRDGQDEFRTYFHRPKNNHSETTPSSADNKKKTPLEWAFDAGAHELELLWSNDLRPGGNPSDVIVKIDSVFAPLFLLWWGNPSKGPTGEWEVQLVPPEPIPKPPPFAVIFTPVTGAHPFPLRPSGP